MRTEARGLVKTQIRCPQCHHVRNVGDREARKWREHHVAGLCVTCRGGQATRVARDRDIGYWLKMYGVPIPRGTKARDVITASGIPPELAEYARNCFPQ